MWMRSGLALAAATMLYLSAYAAVVMVPAEVTRAGPGYADWCRTTFFPLFWLHARWRYRDPVDGEARFESANRWGDKVFFTQRGATHGGYLTTSDRAEIARMRTLSTGTAIVVHVRHYLDTDTDRPRLVWSIERVE